MRISITLYVNFDKSLLTRRVKGKLTCSVLACEKSSRVLRMQTCMLEVSIYLGKHHKADHMSFSSVPTELAYTVW